MDAEERLITILQHEPADRVPVTGLITNDRIASRFGGEELKKENADKVMLEASISCFDLYFVDHTGIAFSPSFKEGEKIDEFGYTRRQERWTSWVIKRPWSNTSEMAKVLERESTLMEEWLPEDHPEYFQHLKGLISAGNNKSSPCHYEIGTGPTSYFRDGLEDVTYFIQEHPQVMKRWLMARHHKNQRHLEYLLKTFPFRFYRVDADIAYRGGLIYSPDFLKEWGWFKRLAELAEICHSHGAFLMFHSDGDLTRILPELCKTGIDMLNPIDVGAGMKFEEVKETYGRQITLVGGLPQKILARGTKEDVRRYTQYLIRVGGQGGGFILSSSSDEFDNSIPLENFEVLLETVRQEIKEK